MCKSTTFENRMNAKFTRTGWWWKNHKKIKVSRPLMLIRPFMAVLILGAITSTFAQSTYVPKPFTQRTSIYSPEKAIYNIQGDYQIIGNCNLTQTGVSASGPSLSTTNGNISMSYVDIDGDATTLNSSSAELVYSTERGANPECTQVVYAGLYWTGRKSTSTSNDPMSMVVGGSTSNYNSSSSINGYTLAISKSAASSTLTTTYTFTPTGGGDAVVFTLTGTVGNGSISNQSLTIQVGTATATSLSATFSSAYSGNTNNRSYYMTATLTTPQEIMTGSTTITINSLRALYQTRSGMGSSTYTISTALNSTYDYANVTLDGITLYKNKVKFKHENGVYQSITANTDDIYYPSGTFSNIYVAYAEVTDIVKQYGEGNYFVADMAIAEESRTDGTGYFGGWGLIVVYENSHMKWRNITIFDGYAMLNADDNAYQTIDISGFKSVQVGHVNMKLGMMAAEGDVNISGDYAQIENVAGSYVYLSPTDGSVSTSATSSYNNYFRSGINVGGYNRNPNYENNMGIDITMITLDNENNSILENEQTSSSFRFGTSQDLYVPFCFVFGCDAYIPDAHVVSAVMESDAAQYDANLNMWVTHPGDTVTFTMKMYNYDDEDIRDVEIRLPLPVTINYYSVDAEYADGTTGSYYFDPTQGVNGTAVWTVDYVPAGYPDSVWATFTLHCFITDNCYVLASTNSEDCLMELIVNGTMSATSVVNNVYFEHDFIQGFQQSGVCKGSAITENLTVVINKDDWVRENCICSMEGDYTCFTTNDLYYCTGGSVDTIPFTFVSQQYPLGTRFYSSNRTTEYTITTGFPASSWGQTLIASVPSAGTGNCESNVVLHASSSDYTPSDPVLSATSLTYCLHETAQSLAQLVIQVDSTTITPKTARANVVFYVQNPTIYLTTPAMIDYVPSTSEVGSTYIYYRQLSDENPCYVSEVDSIIVTVISPMTISSSHITPSCQGLAVTFTPSVVGGSYTLDESMQAYFEIDPVTSVITLLSTAPAGNYFFTYTVPEGTNDDGCPSNLEQTITHEVQAVSVGGYIDPSTYTLCEGTDIPELTLTDYVGHVERWEYRYQAEGSSVWSDWTIIPNNTWRITQNNVSEHSLGNYEFRVNVKSGECDAVYSDVATIVVSSHEAPSALSLATPVFVCVGDDYVLGADNSAYLWYANETGGTADSSLRTGTMTTAWVKAYVSTTITYEDGVTCESRREMVEARPYISAGAISTTGQTVCMQPTTLNTIVSSTNAALTSGNTTGTITYQWYMSVNGGTATALSGATEATLDPNNYVPIVEGEFMQGTYLFTREVMYTDGSLTCSAIESTGSYRLVIDDIDAGITTNSANNVLCEDASIRIYLMASGSALSYSYQWQKDGVDIVGATRNYYYATSAGSYGVTVLHRSSGCSATTAVPVTLTSDVSAPVVSRNTVTTIINGCDLSVLPTAYTTVEDLENGLDVTVTDDVNSDDELTMTVVDDITSESCPFVVVRTYTIGDACGNEVTLTQTITIADNTAPVITDFAVPAAVANENCTYAIPDMSTLAVDATTDGCGTISFVSQSPTAGATYRQTNAEQSISVTVTVKDGCDNEQSREVAVTIPAKLTVSVASTTNIYCYEDSTGAVNVTPAGGATPYTYSWSNGTTTESLSGVAADTYSVTVTDANGCEATASATLIQPSLALAISDFTTSDVYCYGESSGKAKVNVTGGTSDYNYAWNGPNDYTGSTQEISKIAAGIYTVTVTDANGCTVTGEVTLTEPSSAVSISSLARSDILCYGETNGTATVTATGGTPYYSYIWSHGSATTSSISNLSKGTYYVTVTDANGCKAEGDVTIAEPEEIVISTTIVGVTCAGSSNGLVTTNVVGGTAPYTYLWSDGTNENSMSDLSNLDGGTYDLTVTDNNGCKATESITIDEPSVLSATLILQKESCDGGDGKITVMATGGTQLDLGGATPYYLYTWYKENSGGIYDELTIYANSIEAVNLSSGVYKVVIKDANQCTLELIDTLKLDNPLNINLNISESPEICSGGSFSVVPQDGVDGNIPAGTTYCWSNPVEPAGVSGTHAYPCDSIPTSTSIHDQGITFNGTGTAQIPYVVTAKYGTICEGSTNVTVVVNASINGNMTITLRDTTFCAGDIAANNTRTLEATLGNLTNDYDITWQFNSDMAVVNTNVSSGVSEPTLEVTIPTTPCTGEYTYTVSVEDILHCKNTQSAKVIVNIPAWSIEVADGSAVVQCTAEAIAPTLPTVTDGCGTILTPVLVGSDPATTIESIPCSGTVTYTYRYTDCEGNYKDWNYTYTITDTENPVLADCSDLSTTLTSTNCTFIVPDFETAVMAKVSDNCTISEYEQTPAAGTIITENTNVSVYVKDACGNQSEVRTITLTVPQPVTLTEVNIGHQDVSCYDGDNGSLQVMAAQGVTPYTYAIRSLNNTTGLFSNLSAGIYTVNVTDANGCEATTTVTITEPTLLTASVPAPTAICDGENSILSINVNGGTADYSYSWFDGFNTLGTSSTLTVSPSTTTTYYVTVTDANGCTATDNKTLHVNEISSIDILGTQEICYGGNTDLTVQGVPTDATIRWSTNENTESINVAPTVTTTYTVTVTTTAGCVSNGSYEVMVNPNVDNITAVAQTICSGTAFQPVILNNVPTTDMTYSWVSSDVAGITGMMAGTDETVISGTILNNSMLSDMVVTYTITPTYTGSSETCVGTPFDFQVTVKQITDITNQTDYILCNGDNFTLDASTFSGANSVPTGTLYTWTVTPNSNVTGLGDNTTPAAQFTTGSLTNTGSTIQTVTYTVTPITDDCSGTPFEVTITIEPTPVLTLNCPADILQTLAYGDCSVLVEPVDLGTPTWAHSLGWTLISITNNAPSDGIYPEGDNIVTWTMEDECGNITTCDQHVVVVFPACPDAVDYEGNVYAGVRIDCDCWTQRNLESTLYSDGIPIPGVYNYTTDVYPNTEQNVSNFGRLYDWESTIKDGGNNGYGHVQGICPAGWYLPTGEQYVALNAHGAYALKSPNFWIDGGGSNSTGFTSLPGGYYDGSTGRYLNLMGEAYYWSTTLVNGEWKASASRIKYICDEVVTQEVRNGLGYSVRCIKEKD